MDMGGIMPLGFYYDTHGKEGAYGGTLVPRMDMGGIMPLGFYYDTHGKEGAYG